MGAKENKRKAASVFNETQKQNTQTIPHRRILTLEVGAFMV